MRRLFGDLGFPNIYTYQDVHANTDCDIDSDPFRRDRNASANTSRDDHPDACADGPAHDTTDACADSPAHDTTDGYGYAITHIFTDTYCYNNAPPHDVTQRWI